LVECGVEGPSGSVDVLEIDRPGDLGDFAVLDLTHVEGRQILAWIPQAIVVAQSRHHAGVAE
jgi:hypothetical protein